MKKIMLVFAIILSMTLSSCASLCQVFGCAPLYFEISDRKWWVAGSNFINPLALGFYNNKGRNHFEQSLLLKLKEVKLDKKTEIFKKDKVDSVYDMAIKAGNDKLAADLAAKRASNTQSQAAYHVFSLSEPYIVAQQINAAISGKSDMVRAYKDDLRVITGIIVGFDQASSKKIDTSESLSLSYNNLGNPTLKLSGSTATDSTITISDGTIVAYQMSRFCWGKNGDDIVIKDMTIDNPGTRDMGCPKPWEKNPDDLR